MHQTMGLLRCFTRTRRFIREGKQFVNRNFFMKILFSRSSRPQFLMLTLLVGFTSGSEGDLNSFYFSKCEHFLEVLWNEFDCVTVHAVNVTSSWRHRNTSCKSDKDKDKECHFILVVLQNILQLVGQRQRPRQKMSLHLGGTALHLAIVWTKTKTKTETKNDTSSWWDCTTYCNWSDAGCERINNSTQEQFTIQDFRSSWQTVEQALQKNP